MKTTDVRKLSPAAQETMRGTSVQAAMGGMKQVAAAKVFGVTRQAIGLWVKAYREEGIAALKARKEGRPHGSGRRKGWQAAAIVKLITDKEPRRGPRTSTSLLSSSGCTPC